LTPLIPAEHFPYIFQSWWQALMFLVKFELPTPFGYSLMRSSCQGLNGLVPIRDAIYPCVEGANYTHVTGWAISEAGEIEFETRTPDGQSVPLAALEKTASPDITAHAAQLGLHAPFAARARFGVKINSAAELRLVLKCAGREVAVINTLTGQVLKQTDGVVLHIESTASTALPNRQTAPAISFRLRSLDWIQRLYSGAFPWLAGLALVMLPRLCWKVWRTPNQRAVGVLAVMGLLALLARLSVLALIDATSFLAIKLEYMAPAYPILIWFCVLTLGGLVEQVKPLGQSSVPKHKEEVEEVKL
jgi:hypothetical protein